MSKKTIVIWSDGLAPRILISVIIPIPLAVGTFYSLFISQEIHIFRLVVSAIVVAAVLPYCVSNLKIEVLDGRIYFTKRLWFLAYNQKDFKHSGHLYATEVDDGEEGGFYDLVYALDEKNKHKIHTLSRDPTKLLDKLNG